MEHGKRRIIPADAGSTLTDVFNQMNPKDHPRGCGEHTILLNTFNQSKGSSPRMRGAPSSSTGIHKYRRIIPADAGSTRPS